jgi:hypothetical protein
MCFFPRFGHKWLNTIEGVPDLVAFILKALLNSVKKAKKHLVRNL